MIKKPKKKLFFHPIRSIFIANKPALYIYLHLYNTCIDNLYGEDIFSLDLTGRQAYLIRKILFEIFILASDEYFDNLWVDFDEIEANSTVQIMSKMNLNKSELIKYQYQRIYDQGKSKFYINIQNSTNQFST